MPGFGSKLRIKRLAMGLSPREAAKVAGIKQKYVWALEDEEILEFPDRDTVVDSAKAYSSALGFEKGEVVDAYEKLWSDAGTAKTYMQQKYNRKGIFAVLGENKALGYGAAALAAVLFLSLGGYMVWGNFIAPGEAEDVFIAAPEEAAPEEVEETAAVGEDSDENAAALPTGVDNETEEEEAEDFVVSTGDVVVSEAPEYTPMTGGHSLQVLLALVSFFTGFTLLFRSAGYNKA